MRQEASQLDCQTAGQARKGCAARLNLYAMVTDNPESMPDPDGHKGILAFEGDAALGSCMDAACLIEHLDAYVIGKAYSDSAPPQPVPQKPHAPPTSPSTAQKKKGFVQKAKAWAKARPKTTKAIVTTVTVVTAISGAFDEGVSEAAVPEEEAAGAALESEADAEASESATGLTEHASSRMAEPGISQSDVEEAISWAKENGNVVTQMGKTAPHKRSTKDRMGSRLLSRRPGATPGR